MAEQPSDPRARPARGTGSILVTGATGLLGRAVCAELGRRKERFRALVRTGSDRAVLEGTGAWMVEGDLLREGSLDAALAGVEVVLHLAGLVQSKDEAALRALHVEGSVRLLRAAARAGVRRVVAVSSDTVLRVHRSAYAESKARMEAALWTEASRLGLELAVLRPPMMLGPGSPHLAALERAAKLPVVPVPAGAGRRRPVWVGDVADALLAAMALPKDELPERPFDLAGAFAVPVPVLIKAVARAHGWKEPRVISLPQGALAGAARLSERLQKRPLLSLERLEGLAEEVNPDPKMAKRRLGWKPLPLDEILARSIRPGR